MTAPTGRPQASPPSAPRLSIGLPVYNGENYLAAALGSLLDQGFRDFELIIADNASTDGTAEICRVFAGADPRIRYLRNAENIGAAANYNLTLAEARGHYFKWAAHDDVCAPGYLAACIQVLDEQPEVVLCHSEVIGLAPDGRIKGFYAQEVSFDQARPSQRFWQAISTRHICTAVFGVMRREQLLGTIRHGDWVGADRNLLAQLALAGKVVLVPERLFQRREHPQASIHKFASESERLAWFNPAKQGQKAYPTWRRWQEYRRAVSGADLSPGERLACYAALLRWPLAPHPDGDKNIRHLWREVGIGRAGNAA
jgi:glycosyltransferase involved in cell wall biosynthesis